MTATFLDDGVIRLRIAYTDGMGERVIERCFRFQGDQPSQNWRSEAVAPYP